MRAEQTGPHIRPQTDVGAPDEGGTTGVTEAPPKGTPSMAVKMRLRREGKKRQPFYRVVVADVRSPRDGRFIEDIGYYHPLADPSAISIDRERALHWLRNGVQPSDAVTNLLRIEGIWEEFKPDASDPDASRREARAAKRARKAERLDATRRRHDVEAEEAAAAKAAADAQAQAEPEPEVEAQAEAEPEAESGAESEASVEAASQTATETPEPEPTTEVAEADQVAEPAADVAEADQVAKPAEDDAPAAEPAAEEEPSADQQPEASAEAEDQPQKERDE